MTLTETFRYIDPAGRTWSAPAGSVVDGASIPQFFWNSVGSPFSGNYRDASVIHDVYCVTKSRQWEDVHRTFYYAMRASGVNRIQAKLMYAAVYHFGPRWPIVLATTTCRTVNGKEECITNNLVSVPRPYTLQEEDFADLEQLIRDKGDNAVPDSRDEFGLLSLEDIQKFIPRPK